MNTTIQNTTKYKNSPLGLIPEDWEVKTLIDVVDKKVKWSFTGGPFGSNLKSEDYTEKGVRIIQLQNIGDGEFLDNYKIYTSIEKANELLSCNIYHGDIILSKMGDPVARGCFIPNLEERYLMASDGIRVVGDESIVNKIFLLSYINFDIFRAEAVKASTGSTRQRIGLNDLKLLKLPIPKLQEQVAIADCLSAWDKAIEKQNALIALKELSKKALMQQLLSGKKRLKGFSKEWKEVRLKDICDVIMGQSPSSENYNENSNGLPLVQGNADIKNRKTIDRFWTSEITKTCDENDIIMTVRAPVGSIGKATQKACIGRGVCCIKAKKVNNIFIYFYLILIEPSWKTFEQGSTFTAVNSSDIKNIQLLMPEKEEQTAIANVLQCADDELQLLKKKLEQLKEQKKGLMQVLLTGKKRLKY